MILNMRPHGLEPTTCRRLASQVPTPDGRLIISPYSVGARGTKPAEYEKDTWAPLEDLARNHPEAGVHFQGISRAGTASEAKVRFADWEKNVISIVAQKTSAPRRLIGSKTCSHRMRGSRMLFQT